MKANNLKEILISDDSKKGSRKDFHCDIIKKSADTRIIEGFASTRFPDRVNEIVSPSALSKSMDIFMKNPVVLLDHDKTKPIGQVMDYKTNQDGLYVRVKIMNTPTADAAWQEIQQGLRKSFSIGFIPEIVDYTSEFPEITQLELLEISVVTIPANRESLFSIAKSFLSGSDLVDAQSKKDNPKIGWAKTRAQMDQLQDLIFNEFNNLPTEEKIYVESFLIAIQNIVQAEDQLKSLQEDIEILELQLQVNDLYAEIN